jgi:hypothetical protein
MAYKSNGFVVTPGVGDAEMLRFPVRGSTPNI